MLPENGLPYRNILLRKKDCTLGTPEISAAQIHTILLLLYIHTSDFAALKIASDITSAASVPATLMSASTSPRAAA